MSLHESVALHNTVKDVALVALIAPIILQLVPSTSEQSIIQSPGGHTVNVGDRVDVVVVGAVVVGAFVVGCIVGRHVGSDISLL